MNKKILLYFALLMWFVVPTKAQPTIFSKDTTVIKGETVSIPVYFSGFIDPLIGVQFAMDWDNDLLKFIEATDLSVEGFPSSSDFSNFPMPFEKLRFFWVDAFIAGVQLDEPQLMFNLQFEVLGGTGESTYLTFGVDSTGVGLPFGYSAEGTNGVLDLTLERSLIKMEYPLAADDINTLGATMGDATPNPFSNQAIIPFSLEKAGNVNFSIIDITGKEIYTKNDNYISGKHELLINSNMLKTSGIYFYQIETQDYTNTRKIFYKPN